MTTATSSAVVAACENRKKIIIKRKPGQQQPSKEADNVSIRLLDFNIYDEALDFFVVLLKYILLIECNDTFIFIVRRDLSIFLYTFDLNPYQTV